MNFTRIRLSRILAAAVIAIAPLALVPATARAHNTCSQPSHVWISTSPYVGSVGPGDPTLFVSENTTLFFTGVVHADTKIFWRLANLSTGRGFAHDTGFAKDNCVVQHEPEAVRAGDIGIGTWQIASVAFIPWENNSHFQTILNGGTLVITRASGSGGGPGGGGGDCEPGQIC